MAKIIAVNPIESNYERWHFKLSKNRFKTKEEAIDYVKRYLRENEYIDGTEESKNYWIVKIAPRKLEKKKTRKRYFKLSDDVLMLLVYPDEEKIPVSLEPVESPVKVNKSIYDFIIQKTKEGFKPSQIIALIKENFGVNLSSSTVRNIMKGRYTAKWLLGSKKEKLSENLENVGSNLEKEYVKYAIELEKVMKKEAYYSDELEMYYQFLCMVDEKEKVKKYFEIGKYLDPDYKIIVYKRAVLIVTNKKPEKVLLR